VAGLEGLESTRLAVGSALMGLFIWGPLSLAGTTIYHRWQHRRTNAVTRA